MPDFHLRKMNCIIQKNRINETESKKVKLKSNFEILYVQEEFSKILSFIDRLPLFFLARSQVGGSSKTHARGYTTVVDRRIVTFWSKCIGQNSTCAITDYCVQHVRVDAAYVSLY